MGILNNKYLFLFVILFVAFFLRIYRIDSFGIWGDEKASLRMAVGIPGTSIDDTLLLHFDQLKDNWRELNFSKGDVFTSTNFWKFNTPSNVYKANIYSNGSILHSFALHYWIRLFGPSDFWARFLSLIFSFLLVLLVYYAVRLFFQSDKIAIFAALLTAIHPSLILAGQFVRSYSLATFFCFLATCFLFKIIQNSNNRLVYIGYGVSCIVAALSHLFTIYILIGHFLIMIFLYRDIRVWLNYMLANIIVVLFFFTFWIFNKDFIEGILTVSNMANSYSEEAARNWVQGDNPFFMPATFGNILGGWIQIILPVLGNHCQNFGFRLRELVILLIIPLSFLIISFYKNNCSTTKKILIALITLMFMAPVFATITAIRFYHLRIFQPHYAVLTVPYACLCIAFGIYKITELGKIWKRVFYVLTGFLIILMFSSIYLIYFDYGKSRTPNPYMSLAGEIRDSYQSNDTIYYPTWEDAMLTNLYLKDQTHILQKIDTTLNDKVLLVKSNTPEKTELFDFQNGKLRY